MQPKFEDSPEGLGLTCEAPSRSEGSPKGFPRYRNIRNIVVSSLFRRSYRNTSATPRTDSNGGCHSNPALGYGIYPFPGIETKTFSNHKIIIDMERRNISHITQNHWHNGFLVTGHRAMAVLDGVPYQDSDPFILFMDDSLNLPGGEPVGGPHPHAGFETLTL